MAGDGLKTALALLDGQTEPPEQAEQLALLDESEPEADLPLVGRTPGRSGPKGGRPAGRMNRSTEQWVRYISGRYPSPLVGLAEIWSRPVREIAKELELFRFGSDGKPLLGSDGEPLLNLIEAFKLQQSAMVAALPYLHSRMPQALQIDTGKSAGVIVFGLGTAPAMQDDALTLNLQEYQALDDAHEEKSDAQEV